MVHNRQLRLRAELLLVDVREWAGRNFEQNFIARDFAFALKQFRADAAAASDVGVATIPAVSDGVAVPASSPLHYFLKVDGNGKILSSDPVIKRVY